MNVRTNVSRSVVRAFSLAGSTVAIEFIIINIEICGNKNKKLINILNHVPLPTIKYHIILIITKVEFIIKIIIKAVRLFSESKSYIFFIIFCTQKGDPKADSDVA